MRAVFARECWRLLRSISHPVDFLPVDCSQVASRVRHYTKTSASYRPVIGRILQNTANAQRDWRIYMPVKITKRKKRCYKVTTPHGTKAKCTSKRKAEAQRRLLNAVEHGYVAQ